MSPEQMRKKSMAEAEALRHARYAQADGSMREARSREYHVSPAIEAAEMRVKKATAKEDADMGPKDPSPNVNIRMR